MIKPFKHHFHAGHHMKRFRTSIYAAVLMIFLCSGAAPGQTFGKNKVQYTNFDWYYVQSEHFDVYFAESGYEIASFTANAAEEALKSIQRTVQYQITARIPIIVYNSHNDFQQTNVVGM